MPNFPEHPSTDGIGPDSLVVPQSAEPRRMNRRGVLAIGSLVASFGGAAVVNYATDGALSRLIIGSPRNDRARVPENVVEDPLIHFRGIVEKYTKADTSIAAAIRVGDARSMAHPQAGSYTFDAFPPIDPADPITDYEFTVLRPGDTIYTTLSTIGVQEWNKGHSIHGPVKLVLGAYLGPFGVETRDFNDATPFTLSEDEMKRRVTNFLNPEIGTPGNWEVYPDVPGVPDMPRALKVLRGFIYPPNATEIYKVEIKYNGAFTFTVSEALPGKDGLSGAEKTVDRRS
jgi:hypothetical protein